jgi:hypothetical protein
MKQAVARLEYTGSGREDYPKTKGQALISFKSERYGKREYSSWLDLDFKDERPELRSLHLFLEFHTLVVRDGIDPQALHKEFLKIDEYRWRLAPDVEGALNRDGTKPDALSF